MNDNILRALDRWATECNEKYDKEEQRIIALNNSQKDISQVRAARIMAMAHRYALSPDEWNARYGWVAHEERRLRELGAKI